MTPTKKEEKLVMLLLDDLIQEEKRGGLFFKEAAKVSKDPKIIAVFEWLAQQELEHLDVLTGLKTVLEKDIQTESQKVIQEIAGQPVDIIDLSDMIMDDVDLPAFELFKNQDFVELFKQISVTSIIQYAMKIEYQNAQYIKDFMKHIQSKKYADLLIRLIDDEKQHFIALKKLLDKKP